MASMTTKMEAMMELFRASGGRPTSRASATANLQLESAYNPIAFPPLAQLSNSRGIMAPLREMLVRASAPLNCLRVIRQGRLQIQSTPTHHITWSRIL